ncbi:hypothetical protein [Arthrobacter sp. ISL-69]|uniref:hypothetical protein n=1 Tax=Arthrobacter sp. ISL-69 TaxID=2819113 RepID=UPI00203661CA|nr:hypothetical protein [Arthrobacter sp. ISL-69]
MKKILAVVAFAGLAGLTACAGTGPDSGSGTETSVPKTQTSSAPALSPSASKSASKSAAGTSGVKEACEAFNSLYAEYKAIQNDSNAYEDIHLAADDAQDTVTGNLVGLSRRSRSSPLITRRQLIGTPSRSGSQRMKSAMRCSPTRASAPQRA